MSWFGELVVISSSQVLEENICQIKSIAIKLCFSLEKSLRGYDGSAQRCRKSYLTFVIRLGSAPPALAIVIITFI